jgi:mannose-1-phosphate guanylyltransferase/phosphomannomutase
MTDCRTTAIILVGGTGSRMRPLSLDKSKCMISFMGQPLLRCLVKALETQGFTDLVLTSKGKNGEIRDYFSSGDNFGVTIKYHTARRWDGTAHAIKNVVDEMRGEISDTFLVIYGDSLLQADYGRILESHLQRESSATVLYHHPNFEAFLYDHHDGLFEDGEQRTNYGVMDISPEDRILKFEEKPKLKDIGNKFVNPVANAAVYVFEKTTLHSIPTDRPCDFARDLFPLLIEDGVPCFGCDVEDGYRLDIGTIPNYYNIHMGVLRGMIGFESLPPAHQKGIWIGHRSRVEDLADLISPVVIGEDSKMASTAKIQSSVIGNNVRIGKGSSIRECIIMDDVDVGRHVNLSHCIIGENSCLGNGASLPENTVLWSHCQVSRDPLHLEKPQLMGMLRK